jgi:hypothetical protein
VLCAAWFPAVVDTTIVSVALPSIRRAMDFSAGGSQWVLNAYARVQINLAATEHVGWTGGFAVVQ